MHIVIIPKQGFCNRLRALASAHILSTYLQTKSFVNWIPEECCNVQYHDVFLSPIETLDLQSLHGKRYFYNPTVHTNVVLENRDIVNNLDYLVIEGGHEFKHPDMSVFTFIKLKHIYYKSLSFVPNIQNYVDSYITSKFTQCDNIIGVHFRDYIEKYDKADGRVFSKQSPLKLFIDRMNIIVKGNKNIKFFLSTNTTKAVNELKKNFPGIVITFDDINCDKNERNHKEPILNAVINMLLLSKCQFIIGTHFSSFSDESCFFNMCTKLCISNEKVADIYHCYGFHNMCNQPLLLPNLQKICTFID